MSHVMRGSSTYNVYSLEFCGLSENCPRYTWGSSRITWALCLVFHAYAWVFILALQ
ncbi:hypothetical protein PIB30_108429, partial [Stylosanthes scabra]|nr:hypothetical protein [Stylosanthes scabra]